MDPLAPGLVGSRVAITGPDRMGEPMPVAHIARVPDAPVQGVPVGRHLGDALDVPRHAGLAQHPDGRFDP
jgi:hypothetical protein